MQRREDLYSPNSICTKHKGNDFIKGFLRFAKLGDLLAIRSLKKMLAKNRTTRSRIFANKARNTSRLPSKARCFGFDQSISALLQITDKGNDRNLNLKDLYFNDHSHAKLIGISVINIKCFYFWFTVQGNCRNVTGTDIEKFPIGNLDAPSLKPLRSIFGKLMKDLQENSRRRVYNYELSGRVEYDEFYPNKSKTIIDEIDRVLASHYGFNEEELDFIINYDIKYRMGRDAEESNE